MNSDYDEKTLKKNNCKFSFFDNRGNFDVEKTEKFGQLSMEKLCHVDGIEV